MTLVIVGHEKVKDNWGSVWATDQSTPIALRNDGLFAVSDSVITALGTNGEKPILSGLRKVHHVTIKLWKPYFVGGYFKTYLDAGLDTGCFIGFSGSTLTATHALDLIKEHLGKLQISYRNSDDHIQSNKYFIQRHCEYNDVSNSNKVTFWDEDMFRPSNFEGLLTCEYISEVIEHSINIALKSAKKYRLSQKEIDLMTTDFVAGVYCPAKKENRIFVYRMKQLVNTNKLHEVYTECEEVGENQIVVLGMRKDFEARAQIVFEQALQNGKSTGAELFKFLNSAIDQVATSGSFSIDRPSIHKQFDQGKLENIETKQ